MIQKGDKEKVKQRDRPGELVWMIEMRRERGGREREREREIQYEHFILQSDENCYYEWHYIPGPEDQTRHQLFVNLEVDCDTPIAILWVIVGVILAVVVLGEMINTSVTSILFALCSVHYHMRTMYSVQLNLCTLYCTLYIM